MRVRALPQQPSLQFAARTVTAACLLTGAGLLMILWRGGTILSAEGLLLALQHPDFAFGSLAALLGLAVWQALLTSGLPWPACLLILTGIDASLALVGLNPVGGAPSAGLSPWVPLGLSVFGASLSILAALFAMRSTAAQLLDFQTRQLFDRLNGLRRTRQRLRLSVLQASLGLAGAAVLCPRADVLELPAAPSLAGQPLSILLLALPEDTCRNTEACRGIAPAGSARDALSSTSTAQGLWTEILTGRNRLELGLQPQSLRSPEDPALPSVLRRAQAYGYLTAFLGFEAEEPLAPLAASAAMATLHTKLAAPTVQSLFLRMFPFLARHSPPLRNLLAAASGESLLVPEPQSVFVTAHRVLEAAAREKAPLFLALHAGTSPNADLNLWLGAFLAELQSKGWLRHARVITIRFPRAQENCCGPEVRDNLFGCMQREHTARVSVSPPHDIRWLAEIAEILLPDDASAATRRRLARPPYLEDVCSAASRLRMWNEPPCALISEETRAGRRILNSSPACAVNAKPMLERFESYLQQQGVTVLTAPSGRVYYQEPGMP